MTTATDLASSAVQSSRWHHTAASRALAHQLSPEGVTHQHSIHTRLGPKNNMLKSASSINISSFSIDTDKHLRPPPMQPSGSDDDEGSSDTEDGSCDDGACKEWAASVVATKLDVQLSPSARMRQRACSVISADDSDGSSSGSESSSSDEGFWCVPPSSTKRQDTEDYSWSPTVTSDNTATDHESEVVSFRRQLSVKFDVIVPPKSDGREEVKVQESFEQSTPLLEKIVAPSLLRRCQSYSGMSLKKMHGITISRENGISTRIINSSTEQYRVYLLKFIDLLVTREVTMKVGTR